MITQGDFDIDAMNRLRELGGDPLVRRIAALFGEFAAARVADAEAAAAAGNLSIP